MLPLLSAYRSKGVNNLKPRCKASDLENLLEFESSFLCPISGFPIILGRTRYTLTMELGLVHTAPAHGLDDYIVGL